MKTFTALFLGLALGLLACVHPAQAQSTPLVATFNTINSKIWYLSHGWANGSHQSCEWNKNLATIRQNRLIMNLAKHNGSVRPIGCTELQTHRKLSYGRYEVRMKTAAGSGLNTAFFTYIGPPLGVPEHDEIDFEFLGKNPRQVEVTYWRKGKPTGKVIDLGFDSSKTFANYAFEWSPQSIIWSVNGKKVHQTPAGADLPTNPQKLFLSLWSGAKENADWLGPFTYVRPVSAEVMWVKYTPATP